MNDAAPTRGGGAELWRLEHPRHGLLELAVGRHRQLRELDDGFRRSARSEGKSRTESMDSTPGYVLFRDGVVVARVRQIGNHKLGVRQERPPSGMFASGLFAGQGPRVQVRSSVMASAVRQVTFREGKEVAHFDPPPGSAAEARQVAIAASPWKRTVYPVAAGLSRSGWAIAVIILTPIVGRYARQIAAWIRDQLPDLDIPWPEFSLPRLPLPNITLPSFNLPQFVFPAWLDFLLQYSKVWVPVVIGVVLAVVAVQHSRRSRRIREKWAEQHVQQQADTSAISGDGDSTATSGSQRDG